eukprot:TRINITY_DN44947_c0_g1_i1.p1 TRINITY_DN44947_c0_g1~~TRINITY_DN44947_c0_g1_i1.p1  ORF type:complete len:524 (-),score=58.89 TRINITY_DN44947_c0_g1_i1:409-1929(-)
MAGLMARCTAARTFPRQSGLRTGRVCISPWSGREPPRSGVAAPNCSKITRCTSARHSSSVVMLRPVLMVQRRRLGNSVGVVCTGVSGRNLAAQKRGVASSDGGDGGGIGCTDAGGGVSSASAAPSYAVTTDATFRYRSFEWETSCGETWQYEYIVAQQPAGGATARQDARSALETQLPRPPSGWSVVLIPSVSMGSAGKEEVRPLASSLSQRGHRCYILEWPGWSTDSQVNWALARCKVEDLRDEYEDFWCQAMEHIGEVEAAEASAENVRPRVCLVGVGHSAVYALRALRVVREWEASSSAAASFTSLVLLSPTWTTKRHGLLARLSAPRACRWLASWLHSDSRLGRLVQSWHLSPARLKRHLRRVGAPNEFHADSSAHWLFQRPRPFAPTDGASLHGLLDPTLRRGGPNSVDGSGARELADEIVDCAGHFADQVLILTADASSGGKSDGQALDVAAVLRSQCDSAKEVEVAVVQEATSFLPHVESPTATLLAVDRWLTSRPSAT